MKMLCFVRGALPALILLANAGFVYSAENTREVKYRLLGPSDRSCVQQSVRVSTDNQHFAYIASNPAGMSVVFDKRQDTQYYKEIKTDSLVISPDGRHLAFIAKQYDNWFVVRDWKQDLMKNFTDIKSESLVFSPDSGRLAYTAFELNKWYVVIDGKEGEQFDQIRPASFVFSPDSKHLAYIAGKFNKWFVFVDGQKGKEYDYIPDWSKIVWISPASFSYLLLDIHNEVYVVSESLK